MPAIIQSALHPAGIQAGRISVLWWIMFGVCAAVYVLVACGLAIAIRRARSADPERPSHAQLLRGVIAATAVSVVALLALLFSSVWTGRAIASLSAADPVLIEITGQQWWWHVEYYPDDPVRQAITANEIHIPVGRPVALKLLSADVIHSLWIPNLHGKRDLVPGRDTWLWLQADKPGVYRGQCGEYCGLQHAHMSLVAVAEPADAFERWLAGQRAPAAPAATSSGPLQARGREIVEKGPCAMCHGIRGTGAGGRTAPDLTHMATRSTIGAGTLPNTPEQLTRWIQDPQAIKPGNRMPHLGLSAQEVEAVVAYLGTLK
jgi:cytochrome c oxidase subunit 2